MPDATLPKPRRASRKKSAPGGVEACAAAVEALLARSGVELTMGGEPTFVPLAPRGPEWSVDALGPQKLGFARRFAAGLIRDLPAGAVLLEASGKHYPGEPVPRWCLHVQWRDDGRPLWGDPALLRVDDDTGRPGDLGAARALATALARALGLEEFLRHAEEPSLATSVSAGACVLPLDRRDGAWVSDRWTSGRKALRLLPGDSWAGLRLPLGDLREAVIRRALVVEARHGGLVVFIPSLWFDDYAALLAVVEAEVAALGCGPIVLAGYLPPASPRWMSLGLAADPGVIEANLPPSRTWADYRGWIARLHRLAGETGLCARKLHYNGRITGTGGAAHLCFGGPVAEHGPFFTRPDLLPSVLRFWQHHPALSYAFSGQYVGPSSQAPRPDESLPDALEQLELACRGVATIGTPCDRGMLDLLFRDLLTDRGGNTHRAEISVDKLWNPATPNGRMGIVEFRAFETHPDPEVLARTGLLVRAVLARLLHRPVRRPFREWGRRLHEEFFLPTVLWRDLVAICAGLERHGIAFDPEWLRPVWELRFPELGRLATGAGALVFRAALEAWPMLGEQTHGSTTSRSVDSSLERLEAALPCSGPEPGGHLFVNGRRAPFRRRGDHWIAGVRYRAFHLVPGLHPHIPSHAPLRLEWVDARTGRVTAAARYHVWHPRGENYPDLPADEAEAVARRHERWVPDPAPVGESRDPTTPLVGVRGCTLDLRHGPV